jgi:hypothetical protein
MLGPEPDVWMLFGPKPGRCVAEATIIVADESGEKGQKCEKTLEGPTKKGKVGPSEGDRCLEAFCDR